MAGTAFRGIISCMVAALVALSVLVAAPATAHAGVRESGGTDAIEPYADPDANGDGFGDNLAFSAPGTISFVLRADGSLVGPTNAVICNRGTGSMHVSAVRATALNGYAFVADDASEDGYDKVALAFGTEGSMIDASACADITAIADTEPWQMEADQSVTLAFSGSVSRLTKDMTQPSPFGRIEWFVTSDGSEAAILTFDANGGTGQMEPIEITAETTAPENGFAAPDKSRFRNWNTLPDGTGTSYAVGAALPADASLTLYAQWEEDPARAGMAYAVLDDSGTLTLFRSKNSYDAGAGQTVTDALGNVYTGRVYTGFETTSLPTGPWSPQRTSIKRVSIAEGQVIAPVCTTCWFQKCSYLETCDLEGLDTSNVGNMSCMFQGCSNAAFSLSGISDWDTSRVTNMGGMFNACSGAGFTVPDISGWDTSRVTNMNSMFLSCWGAAFTAPDVSGWDTSRVTDMGSMFGYCMGASFTEVDLSGWDLSNVISAAQMFVSCSNLQTIYADPAADWNASTKLTNSTFMFSGCFKLKGGNGTVYDNAKIDKSYARIDGFGSEPGYLTPRAKVAQGQSRRHVAIPMPPIAMATNSAAAPVAPEATGALPAAETNRPLPADEENAGMETSLAIGNGTDDGEERAADGVSDSPAADEAPSASPEDALDNGEPTACGDGEAMEPDAEPEEECTMHEVAGDGSTASPTRPSVPS